LRIKGNVIPLTYGKTNNAPSRIAKVKICKTTVLPPNAVVMLQCDVTADLGTYITEPVIDNMLMPCAVYSKAISPKMCFVNVNDRNMTLKKGQIVATASEADILPHDDHKTKGVAAATRSSDLNCQKQELPIHLESMFENSKSELDKNQQCALRSLLVNY